MKHVTDQNNNTMTSRFMRVFLSVLLIAVMAFSLVIFAACNDGNDQTPDGGSEQTPSTEKVLPKLLFSDEFDSDVLDESKWYVHGSGSETGELRRGGWWTEDSVLMQDGNLVIRTVYDEQKNTFYTGSVDSKTLLKYGYYETRCKMPKANAIWSAFWLMCDEMQQEIPDAKVGGAEIDIFESPYYSNGKGAIQHAIHTAGYGSNASDHSHVVSLKVNETEDVKHSYDEWHTFALDWQPDSYKFYVDGVLTYETSAPYNRNGLKIPTNVSAIDSYIILSVEVAGTGGVPGKSPFFLDGFKHPVDNNMNEYDMSNFSVDFLVDYVRVWESDPYAE